MTVRLELHAENIQQFLKSREVMDLLVGPAEKIQQAAGDGFVTEYRTGKTRARASVRTDTMAARVAEATNRTLTRALDAGRG